MILIENRNYLRFHNRQLLQELVKLDERADQPCVTVETSKTGLPTLKMDFAGSSQYIHSKYDPEREAERLINDLPSIEPYNHVLFIGSGLGYAVRAFSSVYPNMKISIYEPNLQILAHFLSYQDLNDLSGKLAFISGSEQELKAYMQECFEQQGEQIYFFILPIYEKIYKEQINHLMSDLKKLLITKKDGLLTNLSYQKRWIINAVKNFPMLLRTPNILHDVDPSFFKNKPAIIVAAGPSLNEEWENLRQIKERGLAYIFSVGSAINGLIKHEIYPDAACTYDPQGHNDRVIRIIKDNGIRSIPLIFGSTVGFETLDGYGGPLLHMLISQDTVAPQFLRLTDRTLIGSVQDAPSIAVVVFELLGRLGCGQIILVGQNLAYLNNQFYAAGISYENRPGTLKEEEQKGGLTVKNVTGDSIKTSEAFDSMRKQLEQYICSFPDVEVINTTKGGAAIAGAEFIPLERVIDEKLTQKVVRSSWADERINHYDKRKAVTKVQNMTKHADDFHQFTEQLVRALKSTHSASGNGSEQQMRTGIDKVEKALHKLQRNKYYMAFIAPMMRVQAEHIKKASQRIRFENDVQEKTKMIIQEIGLFASECMGNEKVMEPYFKELQEKVNQICVVGRD